MEHIVSFLQDETIVSKFNIELAGITYPDPNYHIVRNNSKVYCLEYVIEGAGIINVNNEKYAVEGGDVYILPAGKNHNYYSDSNEPFKKIWMNVYGPLCDSLFITYNLKDCFVIKGFNAYDLFIQFLALCERKDILPKDRLDKCSIIFHKLIIDIYNHVNNLHPNLTPAAIIKNHIDNNIFDSFTIPKLAQLVNLSTSQVTRLFKKSYGLTPYDYIMNRKIDTAKQLIINTSIPVKLISYQLSFTDEHYFSNCFKARTGNPPTFYRKYDYIN